MSDAAPTFGEMRALEALEAARAENAELRRQLEELIGDFPEPKSNWTKDQWKQLAYLARHRAEKAESALKAREQALREAIEWLDHGKPEPYENHICGPESACDMNCMDVAAYSEWRRKATALTKPEAPIPDNMKEWWNNWMAGKGGTGVIAKPEASS